MCNMCIDEVLFLTFCQGVILLMTCRACFVIGSEHHIGLIKKQRHAQLHIRFSLTHQFSELKHTV